MTTCPSCRRAKHTQCETPPDSRIECEWCKGSGQFGIGDCYACEGQGVVVVRNICTCSFCYRSPDPVVR